MGRKCKNAPDRKWHEYKLKISDSVVIIYNVKKGSNLSPDRLLFMCHLLSSNLTARRTFVRLRVITQNKTSLF